MSARALILAVALVFAVSGALWTPASDSSAKRNKLRPTPCTVEPRTLDEDSEQPVATPLPPETTGFVADAFVDSVGDLPQGEPAQAETVAEIEAALQEFAGCANEGSSLQVAALLTDNALAYLGGPEVAVDALESQRSGESSNRTFIKWISIGDVRVLPNDRVGVIVDQGVDTEGPGGTYIPQMLLIFENVGGRWLLDGQVTIESDSYATISPGDEATPVDSVDEALLDSARSGFTEVDSAVYAEPTMVGARFSLEAMVMIDSDVYPADVACEMFFFERGEVSATVSAYCRAGASLAGRAANLVVTANGPVGSGSGPLYRCEDPAPLAEYVVFSCTVELPPDVR